MKKAFKVGGIRIYEHQLSSLWITAEIKDGRLSLSGVEGPRRNGNAAGSCGQCLDSLLDVVKYAPGWDDARCRLLHGVWKRWHLNDMNAGSPDQKEYIRKNPEAFEDKGLRSHYENACEVLADNGLNPSPKWTLGDLADAGFLNHKPAEEKRDASYWYGTAWVSEPLPKDVISFIEALPSESESYPWML